jgi:hypothetical protein
MAGMTDQASPEEEVKGPTVYCPELTCHQKVHVNAVLAHIQERDHEITKDNNGESGNYIITPDIFQKATTWPPSQIDFDNHIFFLELSRTQSGMITLVHGSMLLPTSLYIRGKSLSHKTKQPLLYLGHNDLGIF